MRMSVERIISLVTMCLGVIAFIAGIVARATKSKKVKEAAEFVRENSVDVASLLTLIAEAETHADYNGGNKRDFVISRYLKEHNISVEALDDIITNLVSFTKTVNISSPAPDKQNNTIIEEVKDNDARGAKAICRIAR